MRSQAIQRLTESPWLHALLLGAAILASYYGLWNAYFTSDDFWMLGWVRHQTSLGDALWAEFGYGLRLLLDAMNWWRVRSFGLQAAPYYWISLAQHFIVTLIVYGLAAAWTGRRAAAFITAVFFATTFAHFEVITWITGSEYSLAAILYLLTLALFALYLKRRALYWYLGALVTFVSLLLLLELALSLPLVLVAYHGLLGRDSKSNRWPAWRALRLHLPFWVLFACYLAIQLQFVRLGSSEAVVSGAAYRPGPHIVGNLFYLVYLIVPPYVPGVLMPYAGRTTVEVGMAALAIAGNALALYIFWKGTPLVKFAVAFIYLSFLPYTLWEADFAGAIRYRYLPAIGFSLLLALGLLWLHDRLRRTQSEARPLVPSAVTALLLANVIADQAWVQRHVENSRLRQAVVADLANDYHNVEPGTWLYIEIPAEKYSDLQDACTLIFPQTVHCRAFVSGEARPAEAASAGPVHWLRATTEGIQPFVP